MKLYAQNGNVEVDEEAWKRIEEGEEDIWDILEEIEEEDPDQTQRARLRASPSKKPCAFCGGRGCLFCPAPEIYVPVAAGGSVSSLARLAAVEAASASGRVVLSGPSPAVAGRVRAWRRLALARFAGRPVPRLAVSCARWLALAGKEK